MTKWPALFFLFFLLNAPSTSGQVTDSISAEKLLSESVAALERGAGDSSIALHNQALQYFAAKGYWLPWMKSHVRLGVRWADDLNQPFVGLDLIEKGIKNPLRPPQNRAEWKQMAWMHLYKGYIYEDHAGNNIAAKKEYEVAYQIYLHQLDDDDQEIAEFLFHHYGNLCSRLGDLGRARLLLQRTIQCAEQYNMPELALYGDLAITYMEENDNQGVLHIVDQANQKKGLRTEAMITLRSLESAAQLNLNNLAASRSAAAKMRALIQKAKSEDPSGVDEDYYLSGYYQNLAGIESRLGNTVGAVAHYRKAINYETATWGTSFRREVGKLHGALGRLYQETGQYAAALKEFQQALQCVLKHFRPSNAEQNPSESELVEEDNTIIESLDGKARAFSALGKFEQALECYERIPATEAKIRSYHADESSKLLALDESRERFDAAIATAWRLYESSSDRRYADRAFRLTEQARGMLLLESLAAAQAGYQLPANVRQHENDLAVKIAYYEQQKSKEEEEASAGRQLRISQLEKVLFDLKQERERFQAEMQSQYPDYAALSRQIHFLESAELPSLLYSNQVLVDFYLTEDDLYVFSGDGKGYFGWRCTALPANFRPTLIRFIQYLQDGKEGDQSADTEFRAAAFSFYQLMLAPELQKLMPQNGSLLIIPDNSLAFLPMEVLLRREAPSGNWPELPWLLKDYSTGYAYSASLLQMQLAISRQHRERKEALPYAFGGFAPGYSNATQYMLTSTQPLVKDAQKMLGGHAWCAAECSERIFKTYGPQCRLLLLAMHGKADEKNTERSQLLFGDAGSDSLPDNNILYSNELEIMHLQADLAVLSACESGFGKLQKGEGVYSLARAFAQAGVPATVMSLWLLHESSARPLVHAFLRHLKSGLTKDEALRRAKLDFLGDSHNFPLSHPFYWAGVNTNGDMCVLQLDSPFPWGWAIAGGMVLVVFFVRRKKWNKRNG